MRKGYKCVKRQQPCCGSDNRCNEKEMDRHSINYKIQGDKAVTRASGNWRGKCEKVNVEGYEEKIIDMLGNISIVGISGSVDTSNSSIVSFSSAAEVAL